MVRNPIRALFRAPLQIRRKLPCRAPRCACISRSSTDKCINRANKVALYNFPVHVQRHALRHAAHCHRGNRLPFLKRFVGLGIDLIHSRIPRHVAQVKVRIIQHRLLYAIYCLVAVISSYSLSELGLFVTLVTVGLLVCATLVWKRKRPQDFLFANHMPRIFISLMCAFVFFVGYLVVRKVQPTNYRAYNLAALAIWFAVMAYLLWTKNRLKSNGAK